MKNAKFKLCINEKKKAAIIFPGSIQSKYDKRVELTTLHALPGLAKGIFITRMQ